MAEVEDFSQPILPGTAASDYERYLRTDELLALQKAPEEMSHRDELLLMTVHQSSELWLKLAAFEVDTAAGLLRDGEVPGALRLLRRAHDCMRNTIAALDMIEHMSPWEYTASVGRARHALAGSSLQGGRANHRRGRDRDAGHARRAAGPPDSRAPVPRLWDVRNELTEIAKREG